MLDNTRDGLHQPSLRTKTREREGVVDGSGDSRPVRIRMSDLVWQRIFDTVVFVYIVFAFVACTTAFKLFGLSPPSFAIVYLGGSVLIVIRARSLFARPGTLSLALLFPVFSLSSVLWSVDPEITLRHAGQLTFTALLAAGIGCSLRPHTLMIAMSTAFVGLVLLSVANLWLQIVPPFQQRDYLDGNEYFTGVFAHKNTLGLVLCLSALCLTYLTLSCRPRWVYAVAAIALLPIFLFTRSTTSLVLYGCILCMPFVYLLFKSRGLQILILLGFLCAFLLIAIILEVQSISPIDIGLELAGKGKDMSGRTALWTIAMERVSDRPWFGVGYQSYWTATRFAGDVDIIRGLLEPSIKHFHNAWLEALVGTGILGMIAFLAVPTVLLVRFFIRLWRPGGCSPIDVAGFFIVFLTLVRTNVETSMYFQHQAENLALIALLFSTGTVFRPSSWHAEQDARPDDVHPLGKFEKNRIPRPSVRTQ